MQVPPVPSTGGSIKKVTASMLQLPVCCNCQYVAIGLRKQTLAVLGKDPPEDVDPQEIKTLLVSCSSALQHANC